LIVHQRPRRVSPRSLLARHLEGAGLELGPGHQPFVVPDDGVTVTFVDRWSPDQSGELFPQLAAHGTFVRPDIVADFNTDRLDALSDESQDFVIASHVLEHLAEPIGFLDAVHRVLRPGGVALLLLPDRHRTRDVGRPATALDHLVSEHNEHVTEVSDDHVVEFLRSRGKLPAGDDAERRRVLDHHRRRSVHVHCWDADEFFAVLVWGVEHLGHQWAFVDGAVPEDESPPGIEFGFVLRRSAIALEPAARSARLRAAWDTWSGVHHPPPPAGATTTLARVLRGARRRVGRRVGPLARRRQAPR
jgi:SAM-dependent methyltransferase